MEAIRPQAATRLGRNGWTGQTRLTSGSRPRGRRATARHPAVDLALPPWLLPMRSMGGPRCSSGLPARSARVGLSSPCGPTPPQGPTIAPPTGLGPWVCNLLCPYASPRAMFNYVVLIALLGPWKIQPVLFFSALNILELNP
uniref:Predicted protein n=1 Tax=Hordeum vulgare subsp. vulgare TaxID=112509 RepID=F2DZR4_HORVV|nr:predicted protein [Hordeum vulgare subsp. vulgare]